MIQTNLHWFLCIDQPHADHKTFTITAGWQPRTESDHTVLVLHKWQIKETPWKDLGNTMQLIRLIPHQLDAINESNDMSDGFVRVVRSVFGWYTGYDEQTNLSYHYVPKLIGPHLVERLNRFDFFVDRYDITIIDDKKWWCTLWSDIAITEDERRQYILWQWFGICLLYGKPTITKDVFTSYKIQVPILRFEVAESLDQIISLLRSYGFVINAHHNESQQTYEITTNDYDLLAYTRILYGDEMNASIIDKILDLQKEIFIQYGISTDHKSMRWKLCEVKRS